MRVSVGTQLAIVTVAVLAVTAGLLVAVLASTEHTRAVAGKRAAAVMVTELFAASVSPAVVFGDAAAVGTSLTGLAQTEDVLGGVVFQSQAAIPVGAIGVPIARHEGTGVTEEADRILVTRPVVDSDGKRIGAVRIAFSLAREHQAFRRARRNLLAAATLALCVTAAILILLTRRRVVAPLLALVRTAQHYENGNFKARAPEGGDLEVATLGRAFNRMGDAIEVREAQLKAELEVAAQLQISILPGDFTTVKGAEIAAMMRTATEVGGDYYDVIETSDGCWLGIGDVTGHGLGAGVIMLMIQSAVAALVSGKADVTPVEVECAVNRVLYENIRQRMHRRDHATLSILRYTRDGTVRVAGAHEDLVVYRAATGDVETFETPGTWVGAARDVTRATVESTLALGAGDLLVLYTDGVTEAMRDGEQFGFDRLLELVKKSGATRSAREVRDAIAAAVLTWSGTPLDDVSIVVLCQLEGAALPQALGPAGRTGE